MNGIELNSIVNFLKIESNFNRKFLVRHMDIIVYFKFENFSVVVDLCGCV